MNVYEDAWESLMESVGLCVKHDISLEGEEMQNLMNHSLRLARQRDKEHQKKLEKELDKAEERYQKRWEGEQAMVPPTPTLRFYSGTPDTTREIKCLDHKG